MSVFELENTYQKLQKRLFHGELGEEAFKSEVERLKFEDRLGEQWKIGWYTGKWYRYEDGNWIQGEPYDVLAGANPSESSKHAVGGGIRQAGYSKRVLVLATIAVLVFAAAVVFFGLTAGWW